MHPRHLADLVRDESGVSAVEYGLLAAFIGMVITIGLDLVRINLLTTFNTIAGSL